MEAKLTLRYKDDKVEVRVPRENLLYAIKPEDFPGLKDERTSIIESLRKPIASSPLYERVRIGMKVVIIADDITRPTPRERIIPVLLDELNQAGVPDKDITVLISLGTHRYMSN